MPWPPQWISEVTDLTQETGSPRAVWRNRNVVAMGFASLFADMSYEMGNAILPTFLAVVLSSSPLALGLIEGLSDGASSAVKSTAGYLSDRFVRRKPFMNIGYLLTGLLIPAIGLARNVLGVAVLKAAAWTGRGIRGPPRDALLVDSVHPSLTGRAFGLQRTMDQTGAIVGPLIGALLVPFMSFSSLFSVTVVPGIAAFLIVLFAVKEVPRMKSNGNTSTRIGFRQAIGRTPRRFRRFVLGVGLFGMVNFSNLLFLYRAQQILTPQYGSTYASQVAFLLYALLNAVYAIASYPVGHLGDRWSSRNLLVIGYAVFAFSALGFVFVPASEILLGAIFAAVGFHMALVDTSEANFAAELLPQEIRGTGYGLLHSVNGIGDAVSSISVSAIWVFLTPQIGFLYAAGLSLLSGFAMLFLTRK